ncbi:hypothetical protein B0T22DRAFT_446894 [Podospora appendiculata]|uniref:Uncharacterized protein n=1 Tax=Podospora appendiculata TaxID=314037 RepID=A0AAE0XFU5_9PEZI|nr:hypothetical protein B0T22DRAFT_446894 [Podospora appendiculata]
MEVSFVGPDVTAVWAAYACCPSGSLLLLPLIFQVAAAFCRNVDCLLSEVMNARPRGGFPWLSKVSKVLLAVNHEDEERGKEREVDMHFICFRAEEAFG